MKPVECKRPKIEQNTAFLEHNLLNGSNVHGKVYELTENTKRKEGPSFLHSILILFLFLTKKNQTSWKLLSFS